MRTSRCRLFDKQPERSLSKMATIRFGAKLWMEPFEVKATKRNETKQKTKKKKNVLKEYYAEDNYNNHDTNMNKKRKK